MNKRTVKLIETIRQQAEETINSGYRVLYSEDLSYVSIEPKDKDQNSGNFSDVIYLKGQEADAFINKAIDLFLTFDSLTFEECINSYASHYLD